MVAPLIWLITVRIFRNLLGDPKMWLFEVQIANTRKIIHVRKILNVLLTYRIFSKSTGTLWILLNRKEKTNCAFVAQIHTFGH